ncbi:hypothetical protein F4820DRAFT_157113 [Hypoxylon rubiginosum]|uniref:Uncharacterized protein n=1 Tax=Hypoxylon rubiginosum TaxID=110542 RepID=A0ACB9YKU0_9PEZI|nr:hypothetical protein F4820DRAFT_157113 [Hypoxylon rubiginosum]
MHVEVPPYYCFGYHPSSTIQSQHRHRRVVDVDVDVLPGRNIYQFLSGPWIPLAWTGWTGISSEMPTASIPDWLQSDEFTNVPPPHRCKRVVQEWVVGDKAYVKCLADNGTTQTHRLVAMSSLSRRACYKCGNVGHYAEVCSSAERLCYNCKQPGRSPP